MQSITIGIDGSMASRAALRWTLERYPDAAITALSVRSPSDRSAADESLSDELRRIYPSVRFVVARTTEDPVDELARESLTADLVVVGTQKTGFIHGRLFGSRGLRLSAISTSPVASVPTSSGRGRSGVVVGVEDGETDLGALRFAAAEAARRHEHLTVVLALGDHSASRDDVSALVREFPGVSALRTREVRGRQLAEVLVEASASASLLVVPNARDAAGGGPLTVLAHDVLLNLIAPTIVVPTTSARVVEHASGVER
jgi:nucleotide-binding universal stress UspA family protein